VKSVNVTCKALVLTVALLVSAAASAESKGSLGLQHSTNVGGKTLASGDYTVRWDGQGDQVEVKIYKGKNEVASVPAKVIQLSSRPSNDSAVVNNDNGTFSLSEIRFSGKTTALRITSDAAGAGSSGASR
jgi:hypothetical protein